MNVPLAELEQYIEKPILKRGRAYFDEGLVRQCEEISQGFYEAVVEGTEDYTVQLTVNDEIVREHLCDCPYDMGPICKHVVAVIYYLLRDEMNQKKPGAKSSRSQKVVKRKTVVERVNELLERISQDELKQFVRELAERDPSFREMFLSSFANLDAGESKAFYAGQIRAILHSSRGKRGFIDWNAARRVGATVSRLLDVAQKRIDEHNYMSAVYIYTAVMEQMTQALQYADDSNGDIGGNIDYAFEMLYSLTDSPISDEVRKFLIDYCFTAYDKETYEGWDWHIGMLRLASQLVKTEAELQLLLARTDEIQPSDYAKDEAEDITYHALLKIRGEDEADKYIEDHIANSSLRSEAIKKALENKQLETARSLAEDGVERDRRNKPGLIKDWYEWLLKIAQAQGDSENIIAYARLLYINGNGYEQDCYALMKQYINPNEWVNFVEELIRDIAAGGIWKETTQIAEIYVRELWWDRLLDAVKRSPDFQTLERFEPYLKKEYADDLAALYTQSVSEYLKTSTGRPHYKTACRYIRRIKKLGASDMAIELIQTLRVEYPQRRALHEELDMV